ncbi:hypothetical protein MtrunA17_Chr2g0311801 [Medicago truncatula]|uniref:Uncharacterized protein n=1 Tax=Medicago truncatula TaxID=3880 RepID=A0A396JDV4_MEDTR|nr:hypothetical protein MtrunA17_Chr2g0311801 [Medicago truncatula]
MTSSSSAPESSSNMQQEVVPIYEIKGRTMSLEEWDLKIQTENHVDFVSLAYHGCNISKYYEAQGLVGYFNLLNGPTYQTLVRLFWVRASIYDREASKLEEAEKVLINPELEGKSKREMGLEPFVSTEIKSSIMGIPVHISKEIISFILRRPAEGTYKVGIKNVKISPWNEIVHQTIFNSKEKGVYADLCMERKMMLKIQNENLLPKCGDSDQPSLEHKIFLHLFITRERTNVSRYIFMHMIQ